MQHRFAGEMHKWMYTNGILLTGETLGKLRDAGLNEIRLNLFVQNYDIEKICLASQYIDIVTVEIPAIPEDFERVCKLLPELVRSGVKYLNLHQLRSTPFSESASYRNIFKEIRLNKKRQIVAERWPALPAVDLCEEDGEISRKRYLDGFQHDRQVLKSDNLVNIRSMEIPHEGLQNYW